MSILETSSTKKVCINYRDSFVDMAFDGCYYYFLSCYYPKIVKYNKNLELICCKPTFLKFNSICYDHELNCFWATTQCCSKKIYKLDACLNPVGCICLENCLLAGFINGISYDCCNDKLVLSFPHSVYSVDKTTGETELIYQNENICITGILSLCPGFVITYIKDGKEHLLFYKDSSTQPIIYDVPKKVIVKSVIYNPCNFHHHGKPGDEISEISESNGDSEISEDSEGSGGHVHHKTLDIFYYNCHCCPYITKIPLQCLSLNFTPAFCNNCICKPCPPDHICCGCGCGCN